ncbi:MAG: hypothetical protein V4633_02145 [Pseudomonadota bacterium]
MNRTDSLALREAGLETAEVIVDVLSDGAIWADVPVVGTAVKLCRAADSVKQSLFAAKLARFLRALNATSENEKAAIRARVEKSPEEAGKVGEVLILVLEQVTDMEKATMLARLLLSYADNVISAADLRRASQAVNIAFIDDLKEFLAASVPDRKATWMEALAAAGLSRLAVGTTYETDGEIYYDPSLLGEALRRAHAHKALF